MILALIDYIHYKKRNGYYNLKNDPIMRYGFYCEIPSPTIDALEPGDIIFIFSYDSFISWIIMYLTKARMSHTAMYLGDKNIIHATTEGIISEPIKSLFGKNSVLLPLHIKKITKEDRNNIIRFANSKVGYQYGWNAVLKKFCRIIMGRDIPYYRISYIFDFLTILLILDVLPFLIFNKFIFVWLIIPYLFLVLLNRLLWKLVPLPVDKYYVKPIDIYKKLIINGAEIYANTTILKEDN